MFVFRPVGVKFHLKWYGHGHGHGHGKLENLLDAAHALDFWKRP
jgi:hypothetical protein